MSCENTAKNSICRTDLGRNPLKRGVFRRCFPLKNVLCAGPHTIGMRADDMQTNKTDG